MRAYTIDYHSPEDSGSVRLEHPDDLDEAALRERVVGVLPAAARGYLPSRGNLGEPFTLSNFYQRVADLLCETEGFFRPVPATAFSAGGWANLLVLGGAGPNT